MDSPDADLFEAWRAGDTKAGNALFERHFDALYRFFRNKTSEAAEDLVQQTFLACVGSKDAFRRDASFRTYLFTVARSKLYDEFARRRREQEIDFGVTSVEDLGLSPTGLVAHKEEQKLLLAGLRRLPIDLQVALELYYFESIQGPALAEVLGIPEGTARSRLRRGRELLRERMTELSDSPGHVESTMSDLEGWAAGVQGALAARASSRKP